MLVDGETVRIVTAAGRLVVSGISERVQVTVTWKARNS